MPTFLWAKDMNFSPIEPFRLMNSDGNKAELVRGRLVWCNVHKLVPVRNSYFASLFYDDFHCFSVIWRDHENIAAIISLLRN